jgi:formylglycine-generating enzyme required for sulfatase activity
LFITAKDDSWRRYAPAVSESFASIINKAMQPKTYNRYATAAEMRNDLLNSRVVRLDDNEDEDTRPYDKGEPLVDMATGQQLVALKPPAGFRLPAGHRYLGEGKQSGEHLLYRNKDGQVVLYIPQDVRTGVSFLIDRNPLTNSQFAAFLNDPEIKRRINLTRSYDVAVAVTPDGRLLLADALNFWERNRDKVLGKVAGLTYTSDMWVPVGGSERLPVVLVSALGATWYAAWLRNLSAEEVQTADGLPCESQWVSAALFDEDEGGLRQYPWGGDWDRRKLNSLSYWAGRDLDEWGAQYAVEAGPTAAGSFPEGASPYGMLDAFGNVWEWLKNSDQSNRHMIKGGAFTSPKPVFEAAAVFRKPDFVSHAIGFRCGWYV